MLERLADRYPSPAPRGCGTVRPAPVSGPDRPRLIARDALRSGRYARAAAARAVADPDSVVFVNHSVEEAVLLADDVPVASADTRWIESEIVIDLPQPRDVSSPEFNAILRDVARRLSDHLASRAQTGGAPA